METAPHLSIIIPAHNRVGTLRRCVQSVLQNNHPSFEIIVVDDGSDDGSARTLKNWAGDPRVRLIRNPLSEGAAASRNRGLGESRGTIIFFLDADCVCSPDWLSAALACFRDPSVVGVEGTIFYDNPAPSLRDKIPINPVYNLSRVTPINLPQRDFAAGNIAFRRGALERAGGFDSTTFVDGREDTDLALRIKQHGRIAFSAGMKVTHQSERWNFRSLMNNARRYACDVTLYRRHRDFFYCRGIFMHPRLLAMTLVPPFFLLWSLRHIKSIFDVPFLAVLYCYLIKVRLHIWGAAWRQGVFVL